MDEHTDYFNCWIEGAFLFVADCMHHGMTEKEIITKLQEENIEEEMLSLILVGGKFLYDDEIKFDEENKNVHV